jgi:5'-3' exonuclease
MKVFLIDGTYELFRHYHGVPAHQNKAGEEVAATRGVLGSVLGMLESGARYIGVATDHVIESFRNDLWAGYKSSAGVPPNLLSQFGLLEECLSAMGVVVWAMTDLEADDGLASAAAVVADDPRAGQVLICTPDKDLGQCARGDRVVCLDRRRNSILDEDGVRARFGVGPLSVPDWLALVGDSSDGYPGLPGWGPKAATALLAEYGTLEAVPREPRARWEVKLPPSRIETLQAVFRQAFQAAELFKVLATLVVRRELLPPGPEALDSLAWSGPRPELKQLCLRLDAPSVLSRAEELAARRA